MNEPKLTIELIPKTCWHVNLRSKLPAKKWDTIRHASYAAAGYRCEICDGVGPTHPVECHERWEYDEDKCVQRLVGFISLCPLCHLAKHIGFAEIKGRLEEVIAHMMKVNGWSRKQYEDHRREAFEVWYQRSQHHWTLDTSWLV